MKKIMAAILILPCTLVCYGDPIWGSKHDFSALGPDPCGFCHADSVNSQASMNPTIPLWDKNVTKKNVVYQVYSSPTMRNAPDHTPSVSSLACLACHDGVSASMSLNSNAILGTDLTNDHPISVSYPTFSQNTGFVTPPDPMNGWSDVPLVNGKVECVTCHNPHDPGIKPFLRIPNTGSALCFRCHNK